jgi:hypothetical protein
MQAPRGTSAQAALLHLRRGSSGKLVRSVIIHRRPNCDEKLTLAASGFMGGEGVTGAIIPFIRLLTRTVWGPSLWLDTGGRSHTIRPWKADLSSSRLHVIPSRF